MSPRCSGRRASDRPASPTGPACAARVRSEEVAVVGSASVNNSQSPAQPSDPNTYARIRNVALQGSPPRRRGDVDPRRGGRRRTVAGSRPASLRTKARLREAVKAYVIAGAVETFRDPVRDGANEAAWGLVGDTVTSWIRGNTVALRYLARALAEGDWDAVRIFDALVQIARADWLAPLDRYGRSRADADWDWAAIHAGCSTWPACPSNRRSAASRPSRSSAPSSSPAGTPRRPTFTAVPRPPDQYTCIWLNIVRSTL